MCALIQEESYKGTKCDECNDDWYRDGDNKCSIYCNSDDPDYCLHGNNCTSLGMCICNTGWGTLEIKNKKQQCNICERNENNDTYCEIYDSQDKCNTDELCNWISTLNSEVINKCYGNPIYYPSQENSNACSVFCDNNLDIPTCGINGICNETTGGCTCDEGNVISFNATIELHSNFIYNFTFGVENGTGDNTQSKWINFSRLVKNNKNKLIIDYGDEEIEYEVDEIYTYDNNSSIQKIKFKSAIQLLEITPTIKTIKTGYFAGDNCNICANGYFGLDCKCSTDGMCNSNGICNQTFGCECNVGWSKYKLLLNDDLQDHVIINSWKGTTTDQVIKISEIINSVSWRVKIENTNETSNYFIGFGIKKGEFNSEEETLSTNTNKKYGLCYSNYTETDPKNALGTIQTFSPNWNSSIDQTLIVTFTKNTDSNSNSLTVTSKDGETFCELSIHNDEFTSEFIYPAIASQEELKLSVLKNSDDEEDCYVCDENYYGINCDKFCRKETTCNFNGECDGNGDCICDVGWSGTDCSICDDNYYPEGKCNILCEEGTESCKVGNCEQASGRCICKNNWVGSNCDSCLTNFYPNPTDTANADELEHCMKYCLISGDILEDTCNQKATGCSSNGLCECFQSQSDGFWGSIVFSNQKDFWSKQSIDTNIYGITTKVGLPYGYYRIEIIFININEDQVPNNKFTLLGVTNIQNNSEFNINENTIEYAYCSSKNNDDNIGQLYSSDDRSKLGHHTNSDWENRIEDNSSLYLIINTIDKSIEIQTIDNTVLSKGYYPNTWKTVYPSIATNTEITYRIMYGQ